MPTNTAFGAVDISHSTLDWHGGEYAGPFPLVTSFVIDVPDYDDAWMLDPSLTPNENGYLLTLRFASVPTPESITLLVIGLLGALARGHRTGAATQVG